MSRFQSPYYGLFHLLANQSDPDAMRLALLGCLSIIAPGASYAIAARTSGGKLRIVSEAPSNSPLIPPCLPAAQYFVENAQAGDYSVTKEGLFISLSAPNRQPEVVIVTANIPADKYDPIQALCMHYNSLIQLLQYSVTDSLTGLFNRKAFDYVLNRTHNRLRHNKRLDEKSQLPFIAMIDIDHFKSVNDEHGHLYGDEVLLRVSQVIHNSIRENDRAYRYGGEEFSVMFNNLNEEQAITACERIRSKVYDCKFPQLAHVSVSIGVERFTPDSSPLGCVERADKALYFSKSAGRNQVNSYWDLNAQGKIKNNAKSDIELF